MNRSCVHTFALIGALNLLACAAHVPAVTPVRLANLSAHTLEQGEPLVVELLPGDRIPVKLVLASSHLRTTDDSVVREVVVKERCFLVFPGNGPPRISHDGKTYVSGSFSVGLEARGAKPELSLGLRLVDASK